MRHALVDITASVGSTTSVSDVVRLMGDSQPQLACVFVVDGENLVGSFAEGALLPLVAQGRSLADLTIAEVMQRPVISVRQSDLSDISVPARLLQQHATDCLAVVDEQGALAGMITLGRLQPHLWEALQGQQAELARQQELAASLSQSDAQYQSLLCALPDLIVRTSAEGVYLDCVGSADFELYCGDADLVSKRGDEILPAELAAQRLKYIQQALQTGELQIYDQQIVIDDTLRTEEVRINVCGDNEVLVIVRDITDRRTLEDTNRAILEAIPDLMVRVNRRGGYLGILRGDSVKRVLLPPPDFYNYTIYDVMPPALAEQKVQMAQQALDTGTVQIYEQQIEIDGELCWEEVRVSPVNPDEVLFMIRDISERKRSEAERQRSALALAQSEATQRAVLAAIPDLLVRVSAEGRYLDFIGPDRSFNLFIPALVVPDGAIADLLPPELAQPQLAAIRRALETRELQVYEQQIQVGDRLRHEELRAICIGDHEVLLMIRDISDRKQAEERLRQSEAQSRAILSAIPDLMFRTTADGVYLEYIANRHATDLLTPTVNSVGQSMVDLLPTEVAQRHLAAIRRALDTRTLQVYEQQLQMGDRMQYEEVRAIANGDNEVLFMIRDISEQQAALRERKQAEIALQELNYELEARVAQRTAALQESEERWQLALQGSDASLWDWNVKTGEIFRTRRWHELRGLAEDAVSGTPEEWSDRLHPEDRDRVLAAMADHLAQKTAFYQQEYRLRHEDGHYLWILDRGQAVWDGAGNPTRIIGSEMDITQRKQAELEAQTLKRQLEFVLSSSPAAIFTCELDGATTFMSDNIVNVSGYTPAEFLSRPDFWVIHLHPEDAPRLLAELPALFEQGQHIHEYRFLHKAGHYVWIRNELRLIRDAQGTPVEIVGYFADIGDRKAVENQLRKSEAALAEAQRMVHLGSWEVDVATRQLSWSDELFQIFGLDPSVPEPDYAEHFNLIHPEDRDRLQEYVDLAIEEGTPFEIELRILRVDGTTGYLDAQGKAKRDDQGQIAKIFGTALDITERKVAELERQSLSNRLTLALRSGAIGCWELDIQQSSVLWDERMYDIYGISPAARESVLPCEVWAKGVHPDDLPVIETLLHQTILGQAVYDPEFRVVHPDGSLHHIKAYGMVVLDAEGNPKSIIGVNLDISDRKVAELERQNLSNRLTLALSSGAIGCWDWDIQQNTILWDERMYELYGASAADIAASVPYEIWANSIHPDDRLATETLLQRAVLGQAVYEPEFRVVHPDGSIHHIKAYGMVALDPKGNPQSMIGVNLDISDRKRSEAERQQAEDRLQQINERLLLTNAELDRATRLKDEFLANMSHELRTPLNAILGMSEGLKEHVFGNLSNRQRQAVETIERSGTHLLDLINDILDLSKIEAGKLELETALVGVQYLCESSLTFVRQLALSKDVGLSLEIAPAIPDIVVDERRIRQVLINLLSNAVKFTPSGGQVTLRARVEQQNSHNYLKLSVTDTGIGIAPGDMSKLFQPFVQIDSSLNRQYNGTGLGLALVRKMTELHGGTVVVTSAVNQGSCFTLDLPYLTDIALPAIATPASPSSLLDTDNCRVLVIEDSAAAADLIARYLEEQGMEAIICPSGDRVMDDVIQFQPALIILDILLPNLSGWDVLRQLKTAPETQAIPVIVASVVDERAYGLSLGASEYLVKPISRHQLQQAIGSLQASHPATLSPVLVVSSPDSANTAVESPLILLAEDNDMNVATVSSYLTALGYRLIYAKDGQTAVELAQTQTPDLILMDIQMPGMDGLEAMQLIRSDARCVDIPIVALTALVMPGDRDRCLAAGASHYLSKPFKMKALKGLIQQLLQPV